MRTLSPLLWLPLAVLISGCPAKAQQTGQPAPAIAVTSAAMASPEFAQWTDIPVKVKPSAKPYAIKPGLANVTNAKDFRLSKAQKAMLEKNAFFATPAWYSEFFPIYEENRYEMYLPESDTLIAVPSFVTTDAVVHTYHLYFDYLLRKLEKEKLYALLESLLKGMISASDAQRQALPEGDWRAAADRNIGFLCVARKLLDKNAEVPEYVREAVTADLASVNEHSGIQSVAVFGKALDEDFTQYIVRGHYTKDPKLGRYFRAMMWLGRITFRQKDEGETRSALLLTQILASDEKLRSAWQAIYEPTVFFVGKADDLGFSDYRKPAEQVYGAGWGVEAVADEAKFAQFAEGIRALEPPKINSMPIFSPALNPDREAEIKGFRLMGQRYTVDADIFQRLIYREVGNKEGEIPEMPDGARMLPMGLDIPATMGSKVAETLLREKGEFDYFKYPDNLQKMREHIGGLDEATWRQNLYWGWMLSLCPLLDPRAKGFPSFMTNEAWARKDLQTFLGSWTELKHDTILYAKQVYAEAGAGPETRAKRDDRGYVEPNPWLFARAAALTKYTISGLQQRKLLGRQDAESLQRLHDLCAALKTISIKELQNQKLTDQEYELIRAFGASLEHFWLDALRDQPEKMQTLAENPAALVADVATDPQGAVLQEAIGKVFPIYVVVPVDGKLRIARGGVFSYYEFLHPMSDRLTDESWREMLAGGEAPPQPDWTQAFIVPEPEG